MNKLTVTKHPELIRLIRPGEDLSAFLNVSPVLAVLAAQGLIFSVLGFWLGF